MLRVAFVLRSTEVHPVFFWFVFQDILKVKLIVLTLGTDEGGVELEIRVAADAVHGLKHRLPDLGKAGRLLGVRAHG